MSKPVLISSALVLAIVATLGWSFELPHVDSTVGGSKLLSDAALLGAGIGLLAGLGLAFSARSAIGKFQTVATSILLGTALITWLAHYTNRVLDAGHPEEVQLRVKQVTKMWNGRGLSREQLNSSPDGYYVFVETEHGLLRLHQDDPIAPDVGPSRTIPVLREPGYWGYPRYSLSE